MPAYAEAERGLIEIDSLEVGAADGIDLFLIERLFKGFIDQVFRSFFDQRGAAKIVLDNETRGFSLAEARNVILLRKPARGAVEALLNLRLIEFDVDG